MINKNKLKDKDKRKLLPDHEDSNNNFKISRLNQREDENRLEN